MRRWLLSKTTLVFLPTIWFLSLTIYGQQPFVTDDADVKDIHVTPSTRSGTDGRINDSF